MKLVVEGFGTYLVFLACNVNVAASVVFFTSGKSCVRFWGGPERPKETQNTFLIFLGGSEQIGEVEVTFFTHAKGG